MSSRVITENSMITLILIWSLIYAAAIFYPSSIPSINLWVLSVKADSLVVIASLFIALSSAILSSRDFNDMREIREVLVISVITGLLLALSIASNHLLAWIILYELASLPLILYLFTRRDLEEARRTSILLATFTIASGILSVTGVLLARSDTGSFAVSELIEYGSIRGGVLVTLGLLLKLPILLLHYWLILLYSSLSPSLGVVAVCLEGSTMFFLIKISGEVLLLPGFSRDPPPLSEYIPVTLMIVGFMSMFYSSLQGVRASSSRELLAFSSIAHANAIPLILATVLLQGSVEKSVKLLDISIFYVSAYIISKSSLFLLAGVLEKLAGGVDISKLRGSARNDSILYSVALTSLFLALPSPPSLKFFSELFLLLLSPSHHTLSIAVAIALAIGFAMSASVLARFLYIVWLNDTGEKESRRIATGLTSTLLSIAVLTLILAVSGLLLLYVFLLHYK